MRQRFGDPKFVDDRQSVIPLMFRAIAHSSEKITVRRDAFRGLKRSVQLEQLRDRTVTVLCFLVSQVNR
jgi:hypothetical protein